jgi:hypothetical protein
VMKERLIGDGAPNDGSSAPVQIHSQRRSWRRPVLTLLIVLALLIVLVPAGVAVANRVAFGRFAFWAPPSRIDFCGRRYYEQGTQSGSPSQFRGDDSDTSAAWKQVASTYSGRPIYGVVSPHTSAGVVCTFALYVPDGTRKWFVYPLSGGP